MQASHLVASSQTRLQAYDLHSYSEVAVKVHKLNSSWSEAKKSNYVKHATREFNIHKSLQHPRIVAFLDIFELDANSFATVLELCTGGDLDTHLKEHQANVSSLLRSLTYPFAGKSLSLPIKLI